MPTAFRLAPALLLALAVPASAEDRTLLDYRDPAFLTGTAFYTQEDRSVVREALSTLPDDLAGPLGDDFAIVGDAEGAFTAADTQERVYLLQASVPPAIDPFPDGPPPLLLVLDDEGEARAFVLPGDVQYQRLVAAADDDGDGRDEVLLETSFTNMGQTVVSLDVVALASDGTAAVHRTLAEVYSDSCANPAGERGRVASVIVQTQEGLATEPHEETCD